MDKKRYKGRIKVFDTKNGYGYIEHENFGEVLVHSRSLASGVESEMLKPDIIVSFQIDHVRTGLVGRFVTPIEKDIEEADEVTKAKDIRSTQIRIDAKTPLADILKSVTAPNEYLSAALMLRDRKRYDDARLIYQKGLERAPAANLVLSYAAFEKGKRPKKAREVYQKGVALFKTHRKIHIDAGILESKIGDPSLAIEYFDRALELKPIKKSARALIHRLRGQAYYKLATKEKDELDNNLLKKAKDSLTKAGRFENLYPKEVNLLNRTNAIMISKQAFQVFEMFERSGFNIQQIFKPVTENIDFIIEPERKELKTTYGLQEAILARILYTPPKLKDLRSLDSMLEGLVKKEQADPGVAFLIIKDAKPLMGALGRRLESGGTTTTIIPIEFSVFGKDAKSSKVLYETLDQWLFRRDLYQDNFPVSGKYFFGRERQIKNLFSNVSEGHHVGIFGLRKVGKTSFLWRVRDKSDTDLVAYVDLLSIPAAVKNCDYILWLIGNELERDFSKKYPGETKEIDFKFFGVFTNFEQVIDKPVSLLFDSDLNRLRKAFSKWDVDHSPKIVVLIDEVERLIPIGKQFEGFKGYFDFFSYWRGQSQHHGDLITVITGANANICEQAQWEGIDNPVYKFYREEFFPPLDFGECSTMIQELGARMGVSYNQESLKEIYSLTGGHPFIARRLCSRICANRPERPLGVDKKTVSENITDFMRQDSSLFEEILARLGRDFPDELKVLEIIAKNENILGDKLAIIMGKRIETIIHHLIGYQLVEVKNDRYTIGLELLRKFMVGN